MQSTNRNQKSLITMDLIGFKNFLLSQEITLL